MSHSTDILEIPIAKTKNVDDLVKWFEQKKVYEKKHPSIAVTENEKISAMAIVALAMFIGLALIALEEKGKLKAKSSAPKKSIKDFFKLIQGSKNESTIEKHIEARYDIDLMLNTSHYVSTVSEPSAKYNLNDAFGIWKNKKISLDKVREEQWGRKR
jgi:hypothetical protein